MGPQVLVRETIVPLVLVLVGLALQPVGVDLALAFLVAHLVGAALALALYQRHLGADVDDGPHRLLPPRRLMAYT